MRFLVTGLPRSGTSVLANLLAASADLTLLDDPPSVKLRSIAAVDIDWIEARMVEFAPYDMVKAPRLTEIHRQVALLDPTFVSIHVARDPRDVYCSMREKVGLGRPTSMFDNARFGGPDHEPHLGVARAAAHYHAIQCSALSGSTARNVLICYEHLIDTLPQTLGVLAGKFALTPRPLPASAIRRQWGPAAAKATPTEVAGPGRWQAELSVREADEIMLIANDNYAKATAHCSCARCRELG